MTCDTLIKPVFAEYAEGRCEAAFQVFPLLVLVIECWRPREFGHLDLGLAFTQTRLERRLGGGAIVPVAPSLSARCCGWCHCSCKSAVVQLLRILWVSRSKVQKRVKQKTEYAILFAVENICGVLTISEAGMDRGSLSAITKYEYIKFSYCIKRTGAPIVVTDANPGAAHPVGGVEISERTPFLGECRPSESRGLNNALHWVEL